MAFVIGAPASLTVRAATHVNPKATKHHTKTRPKKVRAAHRAPQDRPPKTLNPETRGPGRGRARASPARARAASTSPPASAHLRARVANKEVAERERKQNIAAARARITSVLLKGLAQRVAQAALAQLGSEQADLTDERGVGHIQKS